MEREEKKITEIGSYTFGDNYELIFKHDEGNWVTHCKIDCGNNCIIDCGWSFIITCANNCIIDCGGECNIICGNDCEIKCAYFCYIKAGEGSKLKLYGKLKKTISKGEEFIWWYINYYGILINTFEDVGWKEENPDKWNEFYGFVHNELDSATLF